MKFPKRKKKTEIKVQKLNDMWDNTKGSIMQSLWREERTVETELKPIKK